MLKAAGAITDEELLSFRQFGSRLEGHPTPRIPRPTSRRARSGRACRSASGWRSPASDLDRLPYRVWVLCGDSEMAEGSIWEAFEHAGWARLDNLTAIVDVNRLGQTRRDDARLEHRRLRGARERFGWHAIEIDGHDLEAIERPTGEATATTAASRA